MKGTRRSMVALGLVWLLAACSQAGVAADTTRIGGTATAPSGVDLQDSSVLACFWTGSGCDESKSQEISIATSASTATFLTDPLAPGEYLLAAVKDVNRNDEIDEQDYFAVHTDAAGEIALVRPGASGIALRLVSLSGETPAAGGAPVTDGGPVPSSLVGEWTRVSSNIALGVDLKADGTFIRSSYAPLTLSSGCDVAGVYHEPYVYVHRTGTYAVSGDRITFTETSNVLSKRRGCDPVQTTSQELTVETRTWRVGPPTYGSATSALYLGGADASGELEYHADDAMPAPKE